MIKEITIPTIGENVEKGTVVEIRVAVGDVVKVDQTIIEFETDKALVEIPSTDEGKIVEVLVKKGDELTIGSVVARIETDVGSESAAGETKAPPTEEEPQSSVSTEKTEAEPVPQPKTPAAPPAEEQVDVPVSLGAPAAAAPSVRRLARQLGADINEIRGTGPGGRIVADDVKAYVKRLVTSRPSAPADVKAAWRPLPDFGRWGSIRKEPLSRVRSIISDHTTNAWNTIPHVTQFDKADITEVEKFRKLYSRQAEERGGKLTITAILLKVCAEALRQFPRFNASLDIQNGQIIYKEYIHIGVATDTERGLLVPVIRDVDKKPILQLAHELQQLSERARSGKVNPDELDGGTFTISNQGSIGGVDFTPIVSWPQAAILGVSQSSIQPVYLEGEFRPRLILPLSLSYDHRINDGADAARLLRWIRESLEQPLLLSLR